MKFLLEESIRRNSPKERVHKSDWDPNHKIWSGKKDRICNYQNCFQEKIKLEGSGIDP